ncbi:MAG: hypothetical protein HKN03_16360 [Acidimicrobiales bacterium]|nr:hypothetical protein [Acidimicrobiales bacterium]
MTIEAPAAADTRTYDIEFFWDPVCPFAWITSRWIHKVMAQREYAVRWRFISLRLLNSHIDYGAHFPPDYEHGHTAGLRMLRVASAIRDDLGEEAMQDLYNAFGSSVFDVDRSEGGLDPGSEPRSWLGTTDHLQRVLTNLGHDPSYAAAADDETRDAIVQADTDAALEMTGRDVGTPIIAFHGKGGAETTAFFGPVISRVPDDEHAVELWDAVTTLAAFPSFAEMKRSLRERPQLRSLGVNTGEAGKVEDWKAGSRRWD